MLGDGGSGGGGEVEKVHPLLREIQDTQTEPPGMRDMSPHIPNSIFIWPHTLPPYIHGPYIIVSVISFTCRGIVFANKKGGNGFLCQFVCSGISNDAGFHRSGILHFHSHKSLQYNSCIIS